MNCEIRLHEKVPAKDTDCGKLAKDESAAVNNKQTGQLEFAVVWPCKVNECKQMV